MRGPAAERRSFLAAQAGDLWVGDAMHPRAPVIAPDGKLRKVTLFSQIDNATRFILHSYLVIVDGEDAAAQKYGLKQAILKYGVPRVYYVDRGPAYIAHSLRAICAELGVQLLHADAGDAEAKAICGRRELHGARAPGRIGRLWREFERVIADLTPKVDRRPPLGKAIYYWSR